ncbi:hypothetical protein MOUN0_C04368 [Monosporozyma unispora]|nr:hypothetical protein C6P44_004763 [Kazachstania unispora]
MSNYYFISNGYSISKPGGQFNSGAHTGESPQMVNYRKMEALKRSLPSKGAGCLFRAQINTTDTFSYGNGKSTYFKLGNDNVYKIAKHQKQMPGNIQVYARSVMKNGKTYYLYVDHLPLIRRDLSIGEDFFKRPCEPALVPFERAPSISKALNLLDPHLKKEDIELLKGFSDVEIKYQEESYNFLKTVFKSNIKNEISVWFVPFSASTIHNEFPRNILNLQELIIHGNNCAALFYLLDILPELSCYPSNNLLYESKSKEEFIFNLIYEKKSKPVLELIFKILSYDWNLLTVRKKAELSTSYFVTLLESFDILIQHSSIYYVSTTNYLESKNYDKIFKSVNYKWARFRHTDVVLKHLDDQRGKKVLFRSKGNLVKLNGHTYSPGYINNIYSCVEREYNSIIQEILGENIKLGSVEEIKEIITQSSFSQDKRSTPPSDWPSLWKYSDKINSDMILPDEETINSASWESFNDRVEKLTVCLMWMIYISCGGQIPWAKLQTLKYSGKDRHIYLRTSFTDINMQLPFAMGNEEVTQYLMLDENTSLYLIYYLCVIRPTYILSLKGDYSHVARNIFGSKYSDPELEILFQGHPRLSDYEYGLSVMKTMLFINCRNGQVIRKERFETITRKYPTTTPIENRLDFGNIQNLITKFYLRHAVSRSYKYDDILQAIIIARSGIGVKNNIMFMSQKFSGNEYGNKNRDDSFQINWISYMFPSYWR